MKTAIALLPICLAAAIPVSAQNPDGATACLDLAAQDRVTLTGRLTMRRYAGPPTFAPVPPGGEGVPAYILQLPQPICISDDEGFADPARMFDTAHIAMADDALLPVLAASVGLEVTVAGAGFGEHTGHHHAPLVVLADEITVR